MYRSRPLQLTALCLALLSQRALAANLLECQDPTLASMDTQQLTDSLRAAGGEDCSLHAHSWGDEVSCAGSHGRAFGLELREITAEIHQSGLRSILLVSPGQSQSARQRLSEQAAAQGLQLEVGSREDGSTTIRCVAGASAVSAHTGVLLGNVPPIPPGASSWKVCAQAANGSEHCATADERGSYRIEALAPGEYGVIATPLDATDPLLRAMLIRPEPIGINREGGPKVVAERINIRTGATAEAGELKLLRLPPGN